MMAVGCTTTIVQGGGGNGGGGDGGTNNQPTIVNVDEKEPNNGPDLAGTQDVGTFSGDETMTIKGNLSSGGNDGSKYTGDFDLFSFKVTVPGSLDVSVDWTDTADVDLGIYDGSIKTIASDGTTNKPAVASVPSANGQYILGLYSKDNATAYTVTIKFKKSASSTNTDAGGQCPMTPLLPPVRAAGGCTMDATTPTCTVGDLRNGGTIELDWTTSNTFCEGPHKLQITGDPPSEANSVTYSYTSSYSGNDASMTRNIGGYAKISAADIASVTSTSGIYYYRVTAFYGSATEVRAFKVIQ
jgi:hypothetical protein